MTATTDPSPHTSVPPPPPLRLCLRPAGGPPALPDGAWWPHTRDLGRELSPLAETLDPLWGRVTRVAVNPLHWPVVPRKVPVAGRVIRVGWFTAEQDPHKLLLLSGRLGRWDLLVVRPETEPAVARRLMSAVLGPHRPATASTLVEEAHRGDASEAVPGVPHPAERMWEDEGGALPHLPVRLWPGDRVTGAHRGP